MTKKMAAAREHSHLSKEEILLENEFQLFPQEKELYKVTLSRSCITYQPVNGNKIVKNKKQIHFGDIIGCRCRKSKVDDKQTAYLTVFAYPFKKKKFLSGKRTRHKDFVTFAAKSSDNFDGNRKVTEKWRRVILHLVRSLPIKKEDVDKCGVPPKPKLYVLVNPHSGPGRAMQIYQKDVAPMFDEADIHVKVVQTERAGQAMELVQDLDLKAYYGIVICSGDGLIYEVVNGLMRRPDWQTAIKTPIGCLPGGSGNALCCTVNYLAGEPIIENAALHSAFLIIKHKEALPMDLVLLQQPSSTIHSFLSVTWGIVADIDYESEKYRAIGEARFTLQAVLRILNLRTYRGRLSFLPIVKYKPKSNINNNHTNSESPAMSRPVRRYSLRSIESENGYSEEEDIQPKLRSKSVPAHLSEGQNYEPPSPVEGDMAEHCLTDMRYSTASFGASNGAFDASVENLNGNQLTESRSSADLKNGELNSVFYLNNEDQNGLKNGCEENHNSNHSRENASTNVLSYSKAYKDKGASNDSLSETVVGKKYGKDFPTDLLPPLDQPVPNNWVTLEGEFVSVCACYTTHLGSDLFFAPDAHYSDGIIHLIFIKGGIPTKDMVTTFLNVDKGMMAESPSPFVEVVKVLAFRLEPEHPKSGIIMVDGEKVDSAPIQGQVLPKVARIMAVR